ncbi:MAG: hypothetical protein WCC60_12430 [Ilumatobacteraceae bacterium]
MDALNSSTPTLLTAEAIAALPSVPVGPMVGVSHRVLWHDGSSMAGVLTIDAGHCLGSHTHRLNHHHIWVLAGHATVLGELLGPGAYVHVPDGVEHDIDATTTEGCTVYYLYLRPGE